MSPRLTGRLPGSIANGVINWGSGDWYLSGPYDHFTSSSISFNGERPTSATFAFITPRTLVALDADNGGTTTSVITLDCTGNPSVRVKLPAWQVTTLATGWTTPCGSRSPSAARMAGTRTSTTCNLPRAVTLQCAETHSACKVGRKQLLMKLSAKSPELGR